MFDGAILGFGGSMLKTMICVCLLWLALLPTDAAAQDRAAIAQDFQVWLAQTIWPKAQASGVDRDTFETAMAGVAINWDLPDLVIPNAPQGGGDTQAEFRPPARYFAPSSVNTATNIGRSLLSSHARTLAQVERNTGVPARILLSIWGRESSYGRAKIPHDAFEILATKGFLSTRADYFTDELIAAFLILDKGFATRRQMRSSWAGALGQPQFMPSNYLTYATDGDGDERADIWGSDADWGFKSPCPALLAAPLKAPTTPARSARGQTWASTV